MNTAQHVEVTDQFIGRLISSTDAAGGPVAGADAPAADPGDSLVHAISVWAHTHSEAPAYN
ncbi:hypothetical protein [Glycomyces harbinensis]|uniref:Uncharacterized protein n=1 Tax=Glycomyces harbinensis TaxID=58114 RepID=A0A1G7DK52_9ACTN|nr:hypothetical protein [Glycomyces harbinensis]SDE51928.1 hypothetical protein SAMN05216270_1265 [Glycomyces harbinensis]